MDITADKAHTVRNLQTVGILACQQAIEAMKRANQTIGVPAQPWVGENREWSLGHGFKLKLEVMSRGITTMTIVHENEQTVQMTLRIPNAVSQEIAEVMLVYCSQIALQQHEREHELAPPPETVHLINR